MAIQNLGEVVTLLTLLNKQFQGEGENNTTYMGEGAAPDLKLGFQSVISGSGVTNGSNFFGPQHLTELSKFLIDWAAKHMPEAVDSIADNLDKPEHCFQCLGAIFRRIVKGDPPWLWRLVDARPELLLELSPHLGSIRWGSLGYPDAWGEIPGRMGWREWVRCADVAGWLSWGPAPVTDPNASEHAQLAEIDEIVAVASRDDDTGPLLFEKQEVTA